MYVRGYPCGVLNVKELKCKSRSFPFTLHLTRFRVKAWVTESYGQLGLDVMNAITQSFLDTTRTFVLLEELFETTRIVNRYNSRVSLEASSCDVKEMELNTGLTTPAILHKTLHRIQVRAIELKYSRQVTERQYV